MIDGFFAYRLLARLCLHFTEHYETEDGKHSGVPAHAGGAATTLRPGQPAQQHLGPGRQPQLPGPRQAGGELAAIFLWCNISRTDTFGPAFISSEGVLYTDPVALSPLLEKQ